jgi:hypothetical protein
MNKRKVIPGVTLALTIASALVISNAMASENADQVPPASVNVLDTSLTDPSVITAHDISVLHSAGVKLKKPTSDPAITSDTAISAASKFCSGYAQKAKSITSEYHLLTNGNFAALSETAKEKNPKLKQEGFLNDTPVYIVTFNGITKIGHDAVPKLNRAATIFKEYNVVVDATSGEILYAFSYR